MSEAIKLSRSEIAPLVAAARGYESVESEQAKDFAERAGIGDGRTKEGKHFKSLVSEDSVLVMPWYSASIGGDGGALLEATPSSFQVRPRTPRIDKKTGKSRKYEFLTGNDTVLDIHPAIPRSWLQSAPRYLIAEGLLKGDAALTALLRNHVPVDELGTQEMDRGKASSRNHLSILLDRIPPEDRVVVVSIAGVGNWRHNPEWSSLRLTDKDVLVAFDADVSVNWNVWAMASSLFDFLENTKHAIPYLVDLGSNSDAAEALEENPSFGLDDFFHGAGDWDDVENMLVSELPQRPEKPDEARLGQWRVSADGTAVEKCVPVVDENRNQRGAAWERVDNIGGRIALTSTRRAPTQLEIHGKRFGAGLQDVLVLSTCEVEVSWKSGDETRTATISGPTSILNYPPVDWIRHGATIPADVLTNSSWPPTYGREWLRAVKEHNREQLGSQTIWDAMGWVPVEGSDAAAFVIGEQVVVPSELDPSSISAGVTGDVLDGANKFGVHDVYTGPDLTDPTGRYKLADDIKALSGTYFENGPWLEKRIAATVIAAALRPTVPLPTNSTLFLHGAPQKGKSWTAGQMMSFWQSRPGTWVDSLPGTAADTVASTEHAVARTPIWVSDDLAPNDNRFKAELESSNVNQLIRSVHNGQAKRRMNQDMTAKQVASPRALLVVTAENPPSTASIRQRAVVVELAGLAAPERIERADELAHSSTTAARVTAAAIRVMLELAGDLGWEKFNQELEERRVATKRAARQAFIAMGLEPDSSTRGSQNAADLILGLFPLMALVRHVQNRELDKPAEEFKKGTLSWLICEQVAEDWKQKAATEPGDALFESITSALRAGHAHLIGTRPDEIALYQVGLEDRGHDSPSANGPCIGQFKTFEKGGETINAVLLDPQEAFNVAQRYYPNLIKYGSSAESAWKSAKNLGLMHPHWKDRHGIKQQVRTSDGNRVGWFPTSVEALFGEEKIS
jgi:hypothetical protein